MYEKNRCDQITFLKYKKRLAATGKLEFPVATNSMEPLIEVGSIINVSKITDPLDSFDIVVYWTGEILMAHYIWNAYNIDNTILTRSLLNPIENSEPISKKYILGIVTNYRISFMTRVKIYFKCFLSRKM